MKAKKKIKKKVAVKSRAKKPVASTKRPRSSMRTMRVSTVKMKVRARKPKKKPRRIVDVTDRIEHAPAPSMHEKVAAMEAETARATLQEEAKRITEAVVPASGVATAPPSADVSQTEKREEKGGPVSPPPPPPLALRFERDEFLRAVGAVAIFASDDPSRPHLHAVSFSYEGESQITLVAATNGHFLGVFDRVAAARIECDPHPGDATLLIPINTVKIALRACRKHVAFVVVREDSITLVGGLGETRFTFRKVEQKFPPWRQIMPEKSGRISSFAVAPKLLAKACKAFELASGKGRAADIQVLDVTPDSDRCGPILFASQTLRLVVVLMPMRASMPLACRFIGKNAPVTRSAPASAPPPGEVAAPVEKVA